MDNEVEGATKDRYGEENLKGGSKE